MDSSVSLSLSSFTAVALCVVLLACGDDDGSGGGPSTQTTSSQTGATTAATGAASGCTGLCTDAGFSGGTETDFMNGLIECQCTATGNAITEAACDAYCADFGVSAMDAILSVSGDKCVCDGT